MRVEYIIGVDTYGRKRHMSFLIQDRSLTDDEWKRVVDMASILSKYIHISTMQCEIRIFLGECWTIYRDTSKVHDHHGVSLVRPSRVFTCLGRNTHLSRMNFVRHLLNVLIPEVFDHCDRTASLVSCLDIANYQRICIEEKILYCSDRQNIREISLKDDDVLPLLLEIIDVVLQKNK